jgi:hypothetical protein
MAPLSSPECFRIGELTVVYFSESELTEDAHWLPEIGSGESSRSGHMNGNSHHGTEVKALGSKTAKGPGRIAPWPT